MRKPGPRGGWRHRFAPLGRAAAAAPDADRHDQASPQSSATATAQRLLPGYRRAWWQGDLLAGPTVAAYLVPQVMAYAGLAGLPPVAGLWAILPPLVLYAVLGSSRQLSVGPESTTALMTAAVVAPLAGGDPARYAELAAALAVTVGLLCVVAWAAWLGFVADLLSRPVLVGYMAGVAMIMIVDQLPSVDDFPRARQVPGLLVYRYDSPLFFANAEDFRRRALAAVDDHDGPVSWFVLNMEANVEVDIIALDAVDSLRQELGDRDIVFALARVKKDLRDDLAAYGLTRSIGPDRIFSTLPTAVAAYGDRARQRGPREERG